MNRDNDAKAVNITLTVGECKLLGLVLIVVLSLLVLVAGHNSCLRGL